MAGQRPPRRLTPHRHVLDPKSRLCRRCPLPLQHEVHSEAAIAAEERRVEGWKAEEQRRTGERT